MSLNTSATPTVSEALDTRITVRDFLDTPVPHDVLQRILEKSMRSASGGNLQPWKLHVMTHYHYRGQTPRHATIYGYRHSLAVYHALGERRGASHCSARLVA